MHAQSGGFDVLGCARGIRADLAAEYGSVAAAASALGLTAEELGDAVTDTCFEEQAGFEAAAAARGGPSRAR